MSRREKKGVLSDLSELSRQAMIEGKKIDLSGCYYGDPHWKGAVSRDIPEYYYLLSGLVRIKELTHILEIGTHFGGAIMSMNHGLSRDAASRSRLVTVDLTHLNEEGFQRHRGINRIQGDALNPKVVKQVTRYFDRSIDLLFVDTIHYYRQAFYSAAIYANRLQPTIIVFDDIHLNSSMNRLWNYVTELFEGLTYDASALCDRERAGIGLLACRYPFTWSEKNLSLWRHFWAARRGVARHVPRQLRALLKHKLFF